jgi:hypothetical protein
MNTIYGAQLQVPMQLKMYQLTNQNLPEQQKHGALQPNNINL